MAATGAQTAAENEPRWSKSLRVAWPIVVALVLVIGNYFALAQRVDTLERAQRDIPTKSEIQQINIRLQTMEEVLRRLDERTYQQAKEAAAARQGK